MAKTIDFADVTDETKRSLRGLRATFVMASRELSEKRLAQIVKQNLASGAVIFGVANEAYVAGFEGQPQFRTLGLEPVEKLAAKIDQANVAATFQVVTYDQSDVDDVIRAIRPNKVIVDRGSYLYVFHVRSTFALLTKRGIPFEYVSPFCSDEEARDYEKKIDGVIGQNLPKTFAGTGDEASIMQEAKIAAKSSFDYSFQTGCVIAEKLKGGKYSPVLSTYNAVIPYQTYAMHHGNSREDNHVTTHDANHYDTIHAEMNALIGMMNRGETMQGKALFIPLLPCPSCARTLSQTGLAEVVYELDHSSGYAVRLFEQCGISVRKMKINEPLEDKA